MNLEELVMLVLPMLGLVAVAILITKRPRAKTLSFKKGIAIGVICGIVILILYYFIRIR